MFCHEVSPKPADGSASRPCRKNIRNLIANNELKGAVSISNFEEYSCALNNFLIPEKMEIAGNISKKYVADKVGATKMILEETKKFL